MTIKAIETVYRGVRFRSRLEARWAVYFQTAGFDWAYEPEGFEDADGNQYLPDFRLAFSNGKAAWVEVKGDPNWLKDRCGSLASIPLVDQEVILLGNFPTGGKFGVLMVPLIRWGDGETVTWGFLYDGGFAKCTDLAAVFLGVRQWNGTGCPLVSENNLRRFNFQPEFIEAKFAIHKLQGAYRAALAARFEHGETPA